MPVNVNYRKVGGIVILYPEGRLQGVAVGPLKVLVQELLDQELRDFIISFKDVHSIDAPYATALNSIYKEILRSDGKLILSDAGFDVLPWLERHAREIPQFKTEEIAIKKFTGISEEQHKGNIAVVGASDTATELFRGIENFKGLLFHYYDYTEDSTNRVIELKPRAIILNLESGTMIVQAIRKWRFADETKQTPIILFGQPDLRKIVPVLIKEGANDFIEVTYRGPHALAYLEPLDFRNVLARKLDLVIAGEYAEFMRKP